jgi:hypothetical protein
MKWYWWIVASILAINGLLIALIAAALVFDKFRKAREAARNRRGDSDADKAA